MPGIGVISNRNARLNKLYPKIKDRLAFIIGRSGDIACTESLDHTEQAIQEFKHSDIDIVAISGGDGTAHRTIELLLRVYKDNELPPVLLLPTGTQNMVPKSFGVRTSSVTTLLLVQARYRHNLPMRCVLRNMLKVNGHYSFMFGIGVATRFLEQYYARENTTPFGAAKLVAEFALDAMQRGKAIAKITKPFLVKYRLDESPAIELNCHTMFCSFITHLPLGTKCFPLASTRKDIFEVLIAEGNPIYILHALPWLWMGSVRNFKNLHRATAQCVQIMLDKAESYTLDGEIYDHCDHFTITPGPELRFIMPHPSLHLPAPRERITHVGPWDMRFFI